MDTFELNDVLATFSIIVDRREQNTPRLKERCESFGVPWNRSTLNYGDYAANVIVNGVPVYDVTKTVFPKTVIERKYSLDELASCFTRSRDRFRREMERACSNGSKVYLLVENGSYEGIINHRYKSRYNPTAFLASLTAWTVRYNIIPIFCKAETSGQIIKEILYRDMKERLERGEYG